MTSSTYARSTQHQVDLLWRALGPPLRSTVKREHLLCGDSPLGMREDQNRVSVFHVNRFWQPDGGPPQLVLALRVTRGERLARQREAAHAGI